MRELRTSSIPTKAILKPAHTAIPISSMARPVRELTFLVCAYTPLTDRTFFEQIIIPTISLDFLLHEKDTANPIKINPYLKKRLKIHRSALWCRCFIHQNAAADGIIKITVKQLSRWYMTCITFQFKFIITSNNIFLHALFRI